MFSERGTAGGMGENHASRRWGLVPAARLPLGGQGVVVAFTALALAAKYKRSGQEQERRGHQEQEPKSSKNAHNLQEGNRGAEGKLAGL